MRVAVIGAGINGLAFAHYLGAGHSVDIYERSDDVGGLARCFAVEGTHLEMFYHHFFKSDTHLIRLIHELGLDGQVQFHTSSMGFHYNEGITPFSTASDLLKFRHLPFISRIMLGLHTLYLKRTNDWLALEGLSIAEWMSSHMGSKVYEKVWQPLLLAKFGRHAGNIPMSWLWGRIHPRSDSREKGRESLGYMKGGLKTLTDAIKMKILEKGGRFHFKSNIEAITAHGQGVRLQVGGETLDYDRCVVTVDNEAAMKMVQGMTSDKRAALQGIEYMGAVMLILKLSRPLSQTYWLNNASPDFPFSGVIEHTNLVPPEYYNGRRLAYVFKYLSPDDPLMALDRDATLALFLDKGRKIFPELTPGQIVDSMHYKTTKATPVYSGRYSTRIPGFELLDGRVYLLNTAQIYPQDRNLSNGIELSLRLLQQWSTEKMVI